MMRFNRNFEGVIFWVSAMLGTCSDSVDAKFSASLKCELLSYGLVISQRALDGIGSHFLENNYGYDNPNWVNESETVFPLPSEVILPNGIVSAVRIRQGSPFLIDSLDDKLFLFKNRIPVCRVSFPSRPKFYEKYTSDGVAMHRVGSLYGSNVLVFCLYNHCEFWEFGLQCAFCGINYTHSSMKTVELQKTPSQISEVVLEALRHDQIKLINTVSGSLLDHDKEIELHIQAAKAISSARGGRHFEGYTISMPPFHLKYLDLLYDAGVTRVKLNLEVFSEVKFNSICPGKARYGRDKFFKAFKYAVELFGEGNVYSNLIAGLEDLASLLEGFKFLCSLGVVPDAPAFHPDRGSILEKQRAPSPEVLLTAARSLAKHYHEYGFKPCLNQESSRSSLLWETYHHLV